jgi:CHAT domain-containing protein
MFMGVGIIGALASILASVLVGGSSSTDEEETTPIAPLPATSGELAEIKNELAEMRQLLEHMAKASKE